MHDGLSPTVHARSLEPRLREARAALARHFGFADFRGGQADAVRAVLAGRDTLVLMPTGGGKSLCYQVPALALPGLTLVVSPLISLMLDQVEALRARGVPAAFINSTLPPGQAAGILAEVAAGRLKLLYVAPERLETPSFAARLRSLGVALLAVDEAHCISQWGYDFRPAYLRIGAVRRLLDCPAIALTATATPEVRKDIVARLYLRDPIVVAGGYDRPNLAWRVARTADEPAKDRALVSLLRGRTDGVAVVYATTRRTVEALADLLNRAGVRTAAYHAGMKPAERLRVQSAFMAARLRAVTATSAFGMGIDQPNVRVVVHFAMPASLEAYYQEAGRAGRDGAHADCVLLHGADDRLTHEFMIAQSHPPRRALVDTWDALLAAAPPGRDLWIDPSDLARRAPGIHGAAQAEAALRAFVDGGVLRADVADRAGAFWVRRVAGDARIAGELAGPAHADDRALLDALALVLGPRLSRGANLSPGQLARLGADAALRLERLRTLGFIEWTERSRRRRLRFLVRCEGRHLPLDWHDLERRRRREERRLRHMEAYALTGACRRGFVLRYFGDPAAMVRCHDCDNCTAPASDRGGAGRSIGGRLRGLPADLLRRIRSRP